MLNLMWTLGRRAAFLLLLVGVGAGGACFCQPPPCTVPADCGGDACVDGACQPGVDPCSLCTDDQTCTSEGICEDLCPAGQEWDGTMCVDPAGCGECVLQNRTCNADETCGDCIEGYVEMAGSCVPLATCDPPPAVGSILDACTAEGRECDETAAGAECGACLDGYLDNGTTCELERDCADADLAAECAGENRACVEDPQGHCADCLAGFIPVTPPDPDDGCRAILTCADITCETACSPETATADAFCTEPCTGPSGNPGLLDGSGVCIECAACDGPGEDGPYLQALYAGNSCVCKSDPGFYFDPSLNDTVGCDLDSDGWVRKSAQLAADSNDAVLQAVFACAVTEVTAIELRATDGTSKTVTLPMPARLYEENRNDSQAELDNANPALLPYGGRDLRAEELNTLTKACVGSGAGADYNANGIPDVDEFQGMDLGATSIHTPFIDFTYFIELHRGYVDNGVYVIEEKSRDLAGPQGQVIPLTVDSTGENDFWRQCTRYTDPGFASAQQNGIDTTTHDFAQYSDPAFVMGHHSQFKCLRVVAATPIGSPDHYVTIAQLNSGGYTLNDCEALGTDEAPLSDPPLGSPPNPSDPQIGCVVRPDTTGLVLDDALWGVVDYLDYDPPVTYRGGCINECVEEKDRCPGYDPLVPEKTKCDGEPNDYGELTCGCDLNFGGPSCDYGCPDAHLFLQADIPGVQDGYTLAPRSGYWMCGGITASSSTIEPADPDGGTPDGYTLRGYVPSSVTPTEVLCEQEGADGGPCQGYAIVPPGPF